LERGGVYNLGFGAYSLSGVTTGDYNDAVGYYALKNNTLGSDNVGLGSNASPNNSGVGRNVTLGYKGFYNNLTGNTGISIGYMAGHNETISNKLHIANNSGSTLIYGDFSTKRVGINTKSPGSALDVNGSLTIRDSFYASSNVGVVSLTGGTNSSRFVSTTAVTANSIIQLTKQTNNFPLTGTNTIYVSNVKANSFVINSTVSGDTDNVGYMIIKTS
jgi:hypothetical protein